MARILITLDGASIAHRFDLTTEVELLTVRDTAIVSRKAMLMPGPSADDLCTLILKEDIDTLICGGIEDEHFKFLTWKKVTVIDRIIGTAAEALARFLDGTLHTGHIIHSSAHQKGGRE